MKKSVLFAFLFSLTACEESPTGRRQLALLPESQMAAMGAQTFDELKRTQPVETDPRINAYVGCVAKAVINTLPADSQHSWEWVIFRNPAPNAFALPGGKIGVNTGMLKVATTPAQLAAVIGHEIGHVLAAHANERLTQELAVQGGLLLVDLLSQQAEGWKHEMFRNALGIGAEVGLLLPFSRTHEREADAIGARLMAQAGFDPRQSLTLWQNMERIGSDRPPEFLSTHPSHQSRFEDLQAQLGPALEIYQAALQQGRRPQCGA